MATERYVWRNGAWVDHKTHAPMSIPKRSGVCAPMMIIPDITPHVAPTGEIISTRSDRDELRHKHGIIPYERLHSRPRGYINDKFTKKRGLKTCEETQDHFANQKREALKRAGMTS